jgi:DNA-binding response OmpR family regulator
MLSGNSAGLELSIYTALPRPAAKAPASPFFGTAKKKTTMKTIIIQETDPHVLDVLQTALGDENYDVYAIQHCEEDFMRLIEETRPHVVMLDYRLDGKKCLEIFNQIKKKYPHLPLIALSCNHNINTVAPELGFDGYIPKPFDLHELYLTLRRFIPNPLASTR